MRDCLLLPTLILLSFASLAQPAKNDAEFGNSEHQLIYSDATIRQLKHIVDSLNLQFKVCELNRTFRAIPHATGHYLSVEGRLATLVRKALDAKISFGALVKKYPRLKYERDILIVEELEDRADKRRPFYGVNFGKSIPDYILASPAELEQPLRGRWIYSYWEASKYNKASLDAFYFNSELVTPVLPEKYARLIQYVDCMVDTNSSILLPGAKDDRFAYEDYPDCASLLDQFVTGSVDGRPESYDMSTYDKKTFDEHCKKFDNWQAKKAIFIRDSLPNRPEFHKLVQEVYLDAKQCGQSSEELETYVERFISKEASLELKRKRLVSGKCSQDTGPRLHAFEIARLSAETMNWELFLRAHLDIMNDNFARNIDASYAQAKRETYIKELEVLNFNVPDLLLGTGLAVQNAARGHYNGSVARLGRALAEARDSITIESRLLSVIKDKELDLHNRILTYFMFLNYAYYKKDVQVFKGLIARLNDAALTFPGPMAAKAHRIPTND